MSEPIHACPFGGTWWIQPGRLLGGGFPGARDSAEARSRMVALFSAGIRSILCLQPEDETGSGGLPFPPYDAIWREVAEERGEAVLWARHPIPDMGVPGQPEMQVVLDAIDGTARPAYVHCWGGHGRTGTVAGCWLVRHGVMPEGAFARIHEARAHDTQLRYFSSPQTKGQRGFVRRWSEFEPPALPPKP